MAALRLMTGSKNYSSCSMRPWALLGEAGIDFGEIRLWVDDDGRFSKARRHSPVAQVPVLPINGEPYATAR